jgi:hypothetical protein
MKRQFGILALAMFIVTVTGLTSAEAKVIGKNVEYSAQNIGRAHV